MKSPQQRKTFRVLDAAITVSRKTRQCNHMGYSVKIVMDDGRIINGFLGVLTIQEAMGRSLKFIPTSGGGESTYEKD